MICGLQISPFALYGKTNLFHLMLKMEHKSKLGVYLSTSFLYSFVPKILSSNIIISSWISPDHIESRRAYKTCFLVVTCEITCVSGSNLRDQYFYIKTEYCNTVNTLNILVQMGGLRWRVTSQALVVVVGDCT